MPKAVRLFMNLSYPVVFERSTNEVIIRVVDISEANTFGDNKAHALIEAEDALLVALCGYIDCGRAIPLPSKPSKHQPVIAISPLAGAKIALHNAMIKAGVSKVALAKKLGLSDNQVHSILDLEQTSCIKQINRAILILG